MDLLADTMICSYWRFPKGASVDKKREEKEKKTIQNYLMSISVSHTGGDMRGKEQTFGPTRMLKG